MRQSKINGTYLQVYKEVPLFVRAKLLKREQRTRRTGRVLIIDTCLVGDFIASVPAIRHYLRKHGLKADLIVAPNVKRLAQRIRGVERVFGAVSVFSREIEKIKCEQPRLRDYDAVIVMRISPESYAMIKDLRPCEVMTGFRPYLWYGWHTNASCILARTPRQWRDIYFEMLGEKEHRLAFGEIFRFTTEEYARVRALPELHAEEDERIVIIHTGSSWAMRIWSNENWVRLLRDINRAGKFRFVFIGSNKQEGEDFKIISKRLDFKVHSLIGKGDVMELMLVLRLSDYFIGVDSGPRNLAHLADLRSIVLLGPGPHMFAPFNEKDIIIDKSNGRGLYQQYFYKKDSFISRITPEEVSEAFRRLVKSSSRRRIARKLVVNADLPHTI